MSQDQWGRSGDGAQDSSGWGNGQDDTWGSGSNATPQPDPNPFATTPPQATTPPPAPTPDADATSSKPTLLIVAAVIAVIALIAGGVFLYTRNQEQDPTVSAADTSTTSAATDSPTSEASASATTSTTASTANTTELSRDERCSLDVVHRTPHTGGIDTVDFCDGTWLHGGARQTDYTVLMRWNGERWEKLRSDGEVNGFNCYERPRINELGVPSAIADHLVYCRTPGSSPMNSTSARGLPRVGKVTCDGRYIFIVETVLLDPSEDPKAAVTAALDRHPTAYTLFPATCPSLRGEVDGKVAYPIYLDFEYDRSSLCRYAAEEAGNPRTLNVYGDFSNPCA